MSKEQRHEAGYKTINSLVPGMCGCNLKLIIFMLVPRICIISISYNGQSLPSDGVGVRSWFRYHIKEFYVIKITTPRPEPNAGFFIS